MKQKAFLLLFISVFTFSLSSFCQQFKDYTKPANTTKSTPFFDANKLLYGTVNRFICNPHYSGTNYINIKDMYNIAVYEVKNMQTTPSDVFVNTKVTAVQNIIGAEVKMDHNNTDTFSYSIFNLPFNKALIIVLYNKTGNVDESQIKAAEALYNLIGACFQNTRSPKWHADFEYPTNNNIITFTTAKPTISHSISLVLKGEPVIPK